jgi:sortase (surface protein transpeptidase)
VTLKHLAPRRVARRRLWTVVAIVSAVAAVVLTALAAGLLGGADKTAGSRAAAPGASSTRSAEPSQEPSGAPVRARVLTMAKSVPTRLRIKAIGVNSRLMDLGLKKDGSLETPPGAFPAGWFTGAPTPGELGPAIIVGHVRYNTPGVFARLTDVRPRDLVDVSRKDGSTAHFRVTRVEHFAKSRFPTKKVYGNIDHAGLRLITCGGLDAKTNEFDENVVVFAALVQG